LRLAQTAYNPATGAYTAQIEAVTKILGMAWDANKASASTLYYFSKILQNTPEAKFGPVEDVSTVWEEGTYWDINTNSVTPDGELSNYTYTREGPPINYRIPYSYWRNGIEFTKRQIDFLANARNARYDTIQTEFNQKFKNFMWVQNRMLLFAPGAPAYGTGTFLPADQIWDIFGMRFIMNNAAAYYSTAVRPVTGELNCINVAGTVIPANGMYATFSAWQSLVRANNEPVPELLIACENSRQNFVAEMVNVYAGGPGGAGARAVNMNEPNAGLRFAFDGVDFMEWGNQLSIIFEPLMPGGGPATATNEFLFINPSTWELKWIPGAYYDYDQFREGGQNNPNIFWSNMYLHWVLHMMVPKGQGRFTTVTLPAV
jgi:hypothetical protein